MRRAWIAALCWGVMTVEVLAQGAPFASPPVSAWPPLVGAPGNTVLPASAVQPAAPAAPAVPAMPAAPAAPAIAEAPAAAPPPKIWTGSLELGLNAAEGNSDVFNLHAGGHAKRKTPDRISTFDLDYKKDTNLDVETANRLFGEVRDEFLLEPSPWTLFVHGTAEYDEFKDFDIRLSADAGVGYRFIRSDAINFTGRFGAGVSHEIGGLDDDYVPEGVFGLDYEHKFSKCHKFTAGADYYPDWTDFMNYRLNSRAHWEIQLADWSNVMVKIGVNDRYDSTPNGAKHNDLDYSVTLLWSF